MLSYTFRRLLGVIPVILMVTLIVFTLNSHIPGDPGRIRLGQRADPAQVEAYDRSRGYLDPFFVQYFRYLGRIFPIKIGSSTVAAPPTREPEDGAVVEGGEPKLHGVTLFHLPGGHRVYLYSDFGESDVHSGMSVTGSLLDAFEVTFKLAVAGILVAVFIGVGAGIVSAVRSRSIFDYTSMLFAVIGVSMPVFWLGILLIIYVARPLHLPLSGFDRTSMFSEVRSLVLPGLALGLIFSATIARLTRSAMLDVLTQDYVRTARAKGLRGATVVMRHALRNAAIPIVTVVGNSFGYLLVGAVLTESVFALPGLGRAIVDAIVQRDRMVITGGILWMATVFVLVNLAVDLSYAFFDPRVRLRRE